jgi:hypothetical protein
VRYVVCAVQELTRHDTKAAAEKDMRSYETNANITYVVIDLGEKQAGAPSLAEAVVGGRGRASKPDRGGRKVAKKAGRRK